MLEADRYWPGFCEAVGRPEWVADPSLATAEVRLANVEKTVQLLDELFAEHPLTHWMSALSKQDGQWSVVQSPRQALDDLSNN